MTDTNKNKAADLLIELGCEELPPKALDTIRDAFFRAVCEGLDKNALAFSKDKSRSFSTPRRITLLLSSVASGQADEHVIVHQHAVVMHRRAWRGDQLAVTIELGSRVVDVIGLP